MFDRRPLFRWLVPLLVAVVLAAAGSTVAVVNAATRATPEPLTAKQLIHEVQNAHVDGLSGTIRQQADLGLPALPGIGSGRSSDLSSLVTGSHTLRLWYAGPRHVRLALLGSLGESDVIRNGTDLWTWSSTQKSATHRTVPSSQQGTSPGLDPTSPLTPQSVADAALAAITPSTQVSTDNTATVAGRAAYEMVLKPGDPATLVGSVRIAVDAKTHVPTRVQVFARGGGKPAFEVGFSSFDPTVPDPSVFTFTPPPGTKVTQARSGHDGTTKDSSGAPSARPSLVGSGWTSVVVAQLPSGTGPGTTGAAPAPLAGILSSLPHVSGSWGSGRLLHGRLFSAVLTGDGRVAVGAVEPSALYDALAAHR